MMNIFDMLKHYGSWTMKESRAFSAAEIADVAAATVVPSQYGSSVCFMLKSGGSTFIPLSSNSSLGVGEKVDLNKAKLVTLGKAGEADIHRIEV